MRYILVINLICILFVIGILDINDIDNNIYNFFCINFLQKKCVYFDLPFWEMLAALGTIGTISGVFFAYMTLAQSNKQLKAEQTPVIVAPYAVSGPELKDVYNLQFRNIGKGVALKVTVTTDPEGKISALREESPNSLYYKGDGETQTAYLDSKNVIEKDDEIILYLHYFDINLNRYKTISKFKVVKVGNKVVNNLAKDNEVYQVSPKLIKLL